MIQAAENRLARHLPPPTLRETKARPAVAQPIGRTVAYCRVSTDAQAEDGQSLDVQQRQLEGWAMQRGQPLDQVVVEAISGAVPFNERPEGGKLWASLAKGDAWSRASWNLNGGADDVSGNGIARLFLTIVSAFAEFERDRIGERIRATKRAQKMTLSASLWRRLSNRRRCGVSARCTPKASARGRSVPISPRAG